MRHPFIIGAIDLLILAIGIVGTKYYGLAVLSFAVPAIGIVTFFGALPKEPPANDEQSFRRAIAVAIVTVYLVLVGVVAFFRGEPDVPDIAESLIGSFTATVSVVIAFYFGSSAYVEARKS